jgi:hypothetical protein
MVAHQARSAQMRAALETLRTQLTVAISQADAELQTLVGESINTADADIQLAQEMYQACAKRLTEIREHVAKASNLKRQRLVLYMKEVQDLSQAAKQRMQEWKNARTLQPVKVVA